MHPIRQRREAKGWTVAQLALRVRVSAQAVYQWEKGTLPNARNLRALAEVFEMDPLDLVQEILNWQNAYGRS